MYGKSQNLIIFLLYEEWDLTIFNQIDFSEFKLPSKYLKLFDVLKKIKEKNLKINSINIFDNGAKEDLITYIDLLNKIDAKKYNVTKCKK